MYTSIDRVDVVANTPAGAMLVQTDHRKAREVEEERELSVLFALARIINARHIAAAKKMTVASVVYAPLERPPQFLVDALASVGAHLEDMATNKRTPLSSDRDPAEIADQMFAAFSAVICKRLRTNDPAVAIAAIEKSECSGGATPDGEETEIPYWTTVFELMALAGEVIRARKGGKWIVVDHGSVPFGFQVTGGALMLPGNRAQRSLEEGRKQGMSVLLAGLDDPSGLTTRVIKSDGPILPSLRTREEAVEGGYVFRPLLEKMPPDAGAPVICWGHDSETTFAIIRTDSGEPEVDHDAALKNLRAQKVEIEEMDVDGTMLLSVSGSFFTTEKLLDPAFLKRLQMQLRDSMIAVAVPRRGVLLAVGIGKNPVNSAFLVRVAAGEFAKEEKRAVCPHPLIVQDGAVLGMILPNHSSPPDDEPPKKRGFFWRLFGRN